MVFSVIECLKYSKRSVNNRKETHLSVKLKAKRGGGQWRFFGC